MSYITSIGVQPPNLVPLRMSRPYVRRGLATLNQMLLDRIGSRVRGLLFVGLRTRREGKDCGKKRMEGETVFEPAHEFSVSMRGRESNRWRRATHQHESYRPLCITVQYTVLYSTVTWTAL